MSETGSGSKRQREREVELCVAPHASQFPEGVLTASSCPAEPNKNKEGRRQKSRSIQISDREHISEGGRET